MASPVAAMVRTDASRAAKPRAATNASSIGFQPAPPVTMENRAPVAQAFTIDATAMPTTGTSHASFSAIRPGSPKHTGMTASATPR